MLIVLINLYWLEYCYDLELCWLNCVNRMELQYAKDYLYIGRKIPLSFFFTFYLISCIYTYIYLLVQLDLSATTLFGPITWHYNRLIFAMSMNEYLSGLYYPNLDYLVTSESSADLVSNPDNWFVAVKLMKHVLIKVFEIFTCSIIRSQS